MCSRPGIAKGSASEHKSQITYTWHQRLTGCFFSEDRSQCLSDDTLRGHSFQCRYLQAPKAAWPFTSVHIAGACGPRRDALKGLLLSSPCDCTKVNLEYLSDQDTSSKSEFVQLISRQDSFMLPR